MTMHVHARPEAVIAPCLGLLVQLVEMDPGSLKVHREALERAGAVVHAATTADEALSVAPDVDVDVLVCHTGLQDVSAFTLLRLLRRMRPEFVHLPAIALSSRRDEDEIVEALQAGFHIHAVLPIEPYDLVQMVTGLVRRLP
ncbi:MAG: response regulator [Polyangiaceae bacterium]|nr:response regulator [Polyangiaceae bacterium]